MNQSYIGLNFILLAPAVTIVYSMSLAVKALKSPTKLPPIVTVLKLTLISLLIGFDNLYVVKPLKLGLAIFQLTSNLN